MAAYFPTCWLATHPPTYVDQFCLLPSWTGPGLHAAFLPQTAFPVLPVVPGIPTYTCVALLFSITTLFMVSPGQDTGPPHYHGQENFVDGRTG